MATGNSLEPQHWVILFPLLLMLWLLPWVMIAAWMDQRTHQFRIAHIMGVTALVGAELGVAGWLGYGVIFGGMATAGGLFFVPTLVIQWRRRRRRRKIDALIATTAQAIRRTENTAMQNAAT